MLKVVLNEKNAIVILSPLVLLGALAMDIYIPSLPTIQEQFQTTTEQMQNTLSFFTYGFGLGQLVLGAISDRFGRRKVALFSMLTYFLGSLLCTAANNIGTLIIARCIQSIGACGCFVNAMAIVRDTFSSSIRTKIYSRLNGMVGLAPIFAPCLSVVLEAYFYSWRATFGFLAFFAFISCFIILAGLPDTKSINNSEKSDSQFSYLQILKNTEFIKYTFPAVSGISGLFLFCCLSPYLLINELHFTKIQFGMLFGLNGLCWVLVSLYCYHITNRLGIYKTVLIGTLIVLFSSLLMATFEWLLGLCAVGFIVPMFLMSLGIGAIAGPAAAGVMAPFKSCSGKAAGLFGSAQFFLPGLIGTIIMRGSLSTSYPLSLTLILLSAFSISILVFTKRISVTEWNNQIDFHI